LNSFVFRCKVTAKTAAAQSHNSGKTDTKKMVENKAYAWVATVDGQKRNQKWQVCSCRCKKQKSSDLFAILPFSL